MSTLFVPYISTSAGACLTYDNWYELGMTIAAYDFAQLLMKPGLSYLQTLNNLGSFLGWDKELIVDATSLSLNNKEQFVIKSSYDGTHCALDLETFWILLYRLKPNMVLVSKELEFTQPLAISSEPMPICVPDKQSHSINYLQDAKEWDFEHAALKFKVSDKAAHDGYQGVVYQSHKQASILEDRFSHCFEPIVADCTCPTCRQQFTCAYLHHLYRSTPLLCQRFLIMHNVHFVKSYLS